MARRNSGRSEGDVKRELEGEREALSRAVDGLRDEVGELTDIRGKLKARLPVAAAGALGAGFFLAGGIGATARLFMRRSRED